MVGPVARRSVLRKNRRLARASREDSTESLELFARIGRTGTALLVAAGVFCTCQATLCARTRPSLGDRLRAALSAQIYTRLDRATPAEACRGTAILARGRPRSTLRMLALAACDRERQQLAAYDYVE